MYILFKMVDARLMGPIQTCGRWLDYCVGFIPDTHKDIIKFDHLKGTVLTEEVALAWKFADSWKGTLSVRPGTLQNEQLNIIQSFEPTGEKEKYTLTDADKANATEFIKAVMRKILDEVYDARLKALNLTVSELEFSTWSQQREEVKAYRADNTVATPYLQALANARGISISEMATKVESAIAAYDSSVASLLAAKQGVEAEIKACANMTDCWKLLHTRFELSASPALLAQENITTSSTFNL